jgi:enoyl-CoA hydratase/carnithine racemase
MAVLMNHVTRLLRGLPLVTVALLEGSAVGGGAELVSCTDHRLVTPEAHVTFVQTRVRKLSIKFGTVHCRLGKSIHNYGICI